MSQAAAKRKSSPAFAMIVILLVAALAAEGFIVLHKSKKPAEAQDAIRAGAAQKVETFGAASAPIKIEFYAPLVLPWHQKTIGLLRDWDKRHPGRISVKLIPMGNDAEDRIMQARGFTCAVIFINGRHEFILPNGKQVDLQKKPNTEDASFYNSEDVITILDHWK